MRRTVYLVFVVFALLLVAVLSGCAGNVGDDALDPNHSVAKGLDTYTDEEAPTARQQPSDVTLSVNVSDSRREEVQADNNCPSPHPIFTYPPVNLNKTAVFVPLGLMIGNHVTPVDHQYFQDFANDKPDIEVYAVADGEILNIQHMAGEFYDPQEGKVVPWNDYRLEIQHGCGISSIYIHVTMLSERLMAYAPVDAGYKSVRIPVKAGEILGYYKNNVDFNLVDQNVLLPGLLIKEHYEAEPWKVHVPDTLAYFTDDIKEQLITKSLRVDEPIGGKLDWDIDGKLRGNWFEQGTNYYAGLNRENYWVSHLSISPDYLDHSHIIVSMGNFNGTEAQFGVRGNAPDPAKVDVSSGLVTYELVPYSYYTPGGARWDGTSLAKGLVAKNYDDESAVQGVILLQLLDERTLKVQIFPGKKATVIKGFSADAKIYER